MCVLIAGCKKPIEENIIGIWQLIVNDDKNCCEHSKITFFKDGTVTSTRPIPGASGMWYKKNNEIHIDISAMIEIVDVTTYNDTCNVTYQIVDCKRNRLFIQDVDFNGPCNQNSYFLGTLGEVLEYKRVK